ncbi:pentapeptide repeat-containing protein [Streptomyces asoensis]|uniref:pentapeptide repeat-containing protein n=1 Tax=Streptomyces asoensis TaxID=249586 RepID=UPI0036B944D1
MTFLSRSVDLERRQARARRAERLRRWGLATVVAFGALALLVGLPWLIWRGPFLLDGKYLDRKALGDGSAALVTGLRTAMVAVAAALGAGIALLYTARTYRLTRRGQITDRFTKALERLGSPEIYIRIGGILALEQIVQDAPGQAATDAAHVLGHFIRHRAPKTRAPDDPATDPLPDEPAADVQAALTALTRPGSRTRVDPREVLDLHGLHLAGARLRFADLSYANLSKATLTKANLIGARLTDADLSGATLPNASLFRTVLTRALLIEATLTDALLLEARLTGANLSRAVLTGATLCWATLSEADLSGATLAEADLENATLTGVVTDENTVMPQGYVQT